MTETTQTTDTKEIKPMTVEELLGFFQVDLTKIDKTTLSKKIYLVNDKCPCMFVTTGSKVQGEFDDSDIYFKTRKVYCDETLTHIDPPLLDENGNLVLDKDGFPEYNITVVDFIKYLNIDTKNILPIVLLKPMCVKFIGNGSPIPIVDIDSTDSGDIVLKVNTNVKIPTKE